MKRSILLVFLFLALSPVIHAQVSGVGSLNGKITDTEGAPLPFAYIRIDTLKLYTVSGSKGFFELKNVPTGSYTLSVSSIGYKKFAQKVTIPDADSVFLNIPLKEDSLYLDEVVISGEKETEAEKTERTGFHVDVVEMEKFEVQSVDINSILDHTAGVRVKRNGGLGSDVDYSLDGMSGNSIRFLVDGIPIDFFGSVYNINNFPVSLIDRVEIYKGVVPVDLATDALGGAINVITNTEHQDFLEASYSFGSFNTHQVSVQGQWSDPNSGFTARLSSFLNYSDNDYRVWGKTVTYYDESTGYQPVEFTKENPATRFNDDYRAICIKTDIGFTNRKWADQFFVGLLTSDVDRGVQHGQTMSYVFGDMRYQERFYMPNLSYAKQDFLTDRLDVKIFSSYAKTNAVAIDTSTANYNWKGDVVSIDMDGGERRNQRSMFYLWDKTLTNRFTANYEINDHFELVFNFLNTDVNRTGDDEFRPYHTIPFTEPQYLKKSFAGLSFNSTLFDEHLQSDVFIKHYGYHASITEINITDEDSDEQVLEISNRQNNIGGGIANTFTVNEQILIKLSGEKAIRLPDTREALGNGVNILNSPHIKPEKSFNLNLGVVLGHYYLENHAFQFSLSSFYRDTRDKIAPSLPSGAGGEITFGNIDKILGKGVEMEAIYYYKSNLEFDFNITYLNQRNNLRKTKHGEKNILYWDRLRNDPYLMSNATLNLKQKNFLQENSKSSFYCRAGYVHEYFLGWPSLGSKNTKSVIPSQFVVDLGVGHTFPEQHISIGLDASNIFNAQVYDNFLLQKPGRAFAIKLSYRIQKM